MTVRYMAPVSVALLEECPDWWSQVEGLRAVEAGPVRVWPDGGDPYRLVVIEDDGAPVELHGKLASFTPQSHYDERGVCTRVTIMSRRELDPAVLG